MFFYLRTTTNHENHTVLKMFQPIKLICELLSKCVTKSTLMLVCRLQKEKKENEGMKTIK